MSNHEHIVMGMRDGWGHELPFALLHHDRRHHLYTLGKSGVGKTTLLRNMIVQDILAGHDPEDVQSNERALRGGGRLFSAYRSSQDIKFWIITECDRSVTTVLLPKDY